MITKEKLDEIEQALVKLGYGRANPSDPTVGLCSELATAHGVVFTNVGKSKFPNWPLFSGSFGYPIPVRNRVVTATSARTEFDAHAEYVYYRQNDINMWLERDSYGQARLRFCRWVARHMDESWFEELS